LDNQWVVLIGVTGEENNKNGSGSLWTTNGSEESSLFVTDGQIGTVKLKTTIRGTVEFLENLGRFYHGIFRTIQASAM